MNKRTFWILLLSICTLMAKAQERRKTKNFDKDEERFFRVGGKIGTNVNKLPGLSYGKSFSYNYLLGGFLQFNFSDRFGLQPEVNWVQSKTTTTNEITEIYDDLTGDGDQQGYTFNHLEIPILLNINVGQSKHFKLQAGPYYGIRLNKKTDSVPGTFQINPTNQFGFAGGIWLQLPVVYIGGRYKYGFTGNSYNINNEKWHNQAIQIFIGFTI